MFEARRPVVDELIQAQNARKGFVFAGGGANDVSAVVLATPFVPRLFGER